MPLLCGSCCECVKVKIFYIYTEKKIFLCWAWEYATIRTTRLTWGPMLSLFAAKCCSTVLIAARHSREPGSIVRRVQDK